MSAKKKPKGPPKPKCVVCGSQLLDIGRCRFNCPPEASKTHLRSIDKKLKLRQRQADRGDVGGYLTPAEVAAGAAKVVPERLAQLDSLAAQVRGDTRSKGWTKR